MTSFYRLQAEQILTATTYLVPASGGTEPVPFSALIHGIGQVTLQLIIPASVKTMCGSHNRLLLIVLLQNTTCLALQNCRYTVTKASAFSGTCGQYSTYAQVSSEK
jgi:hypothetical protein